MPKLLMIHICQSCNVLLFLKSEVFLEALQVKKGIRDDKNEDSELLSRIGSISARLSSNNEKQINKT